MDPVRRQTDTSFIYPHTGGTGKQTDPAMPLPSDSRDCRHTELNDEITAMAGKLQKLSVKPRENGASLSRQGLPPLSIYPAPGGGLLAPLMQDALTSFQGQQAQPAEQSPQKEWTILNYTDHKDTGTKADSWASALSALTKSPEGHSLSDFIAGSCSIDDNIRKAAASIKEKNMALPEAFQVLSRAVPADSLSGYYSSVPSWIGTLREAVKTLSAHPAYGPCRDAIMDDVEKDYYRAGSIDSMSPDNLCSLNLLMALAPCDGELSERLDTMMKPILEEDIKKGYVWTSVIDESRPCEKEKRSLTEHYRIVSIEKNLQKYQQENLSPSVIIDLDREITRLNRRIIGQAAQKEMDQQSRDAMIASLGRSAIGKDVQSLSQFTRNTEHMRNAIYSIAAMAEDEKNIPAEAQRLLATVKNPPPAPEGPDLTHHASIIGFDACLMSSVDDDPSDPLTDGLIAYRRERKKEKKEEALQELGTPGLTRSERKKLRERYKSIDTLDRPDLPYHLPDIGLDMAFFKAAGTGIEGADPSSGLHDLPSSFSDPVNAWKIYLTLAPGAERDEQIGPEWQKFKGIMEAMGGERNLRETIEAYGFAAKKEQEGIEWDQVIEHIYINRSLNRDYKTMPIASPDDLPPSFLIDESDEDLCIDGIRIRKNNGDLS